MNEKTPLTSLPEEIIQDHLGPCLTGIEIIRLSETCRRLYTQFNVDSIWREKTRLEGLKISSQIERIATRFRDENYPETDSEDSIPAASLDKLQYLVARMIRRNISKNNFKREFGPQSATSALRRDRSVWSVKHSTPRWTWLSPAQFFFWFSPTPRRREGRNCSSISRPITWKMISNSSGKSPVYLAAKCTLSRLSMIISSSSTLLRTV